MVFIGNGNACHDILLANEFSVTSDPCACKAKRYGMRLIGQVCFYPC